MSFIILEFITNPYFGYGFYANVAEAGKEMELIFQTKRVTVKKDVS